MSMTFRQLQDEIINARFTETQRASVQRWLNLSGAELWNMSNWKFKNGNATVTVTTGSATVTGLPSDLLTANSLYRADGLELRWLTFADYQNIYYAQTATSQPVDFTVQNGVVLVGPVSSETSSAYELTYQKKWLDMVADADLPPIPTEYHYLLVHGAMARGLRLENDFTADFQDNDWQAGIQAMQGDYLADERGDNDVYGRDPLGAGWY